MPTQQMQKIEPFTEETIVPLRPGREHLVVSPELRARKRELARGVAEGLNGYFREKKYPIEAYEYTTETGRLTSVGVSHIGGHQFATIRVTDGMELIVDWLRGYRTQARKFAEWFEKNKLKFQGMYVHVIYRGDCGALALQPKPHRPPAPPKQLRVAALVYDVARAVKMPEVLAQIEAELDRHGLRGKLRAAVRESVLRGK